MTLYTLSWYDKHGMPHVRVNLTLGAHGELCRDVVAEYGHRLRSERQPAEYRAEEAEAVMAQLRENML